MGHYASEMSNTWNPAGIPHWYELGYRVAGLLEDILVCPFCKALIREADVKEHHWYHDDKKGLANG